MDKRNRLTRNRIRPRTAWILCAVVLASAGIAVYGFWPGGMPGAEAAQPAALPPGDVPAISGGSAPSWPGVAIAAPMQAATSAQDPLFAQGRYAEAYAADLEAAKKLSPGALYKLDAVLAACAGVPRSETDYQQWLARHASDESPGFDYMRKMMPSCAGVPAPTFQELSALYSTYAAQGQAEGYYMLGLLYPFGSAMSGIWLEKAAEAGSADAAAQLGESYLQRGGSEADRTQAYRWYFLSQSLGDRSAGGRLDGIAAGLTREDISEARREAVAALSSPAPGQP